MSRIREKTIAGLKAGDCFVLTRTFSEQDTAAFAELSRDYNPVHFDDRFAGAFRFPGRICHGLLIGSMLTQVGGQIGWLAAEMNFSYKKPVYFGDTIECRFTITDLNERSWGKAEVVYTNQHGEVVLEAWVTGVLPREEHKRVLQAMIAEGDPTNGLRPASSCSD